MGAARFATAVGAAAASGTRALGAVETGIERLLALVMLGLSLLGLLWPRVLAYPLALVFLWLSVALALRARRNARQRRASRSVGPATSGAGRPGGPRSDRQ